MNNRLEYSNYTHQWSNADIDWAVDEDVFEEEYEEQINDSCYAGWPASAASQEVLDMLTSVEFWEDVRKEDEAKAETEAGQ